MAEAFSSVQEEEVWGAGGAIQVELAAGVGTDGRLVSRSFDPWFLEQAPFQLLKSITDPWCSHTGCHVDGGVDSADILRLVVSTAHVETSVSLVLECSSSAGERQRRSDH
jgi:hypothetical protein